MLHELAWVQGPTAIKVLQPLVEEDLSKVYFSSFMKLAIKGVPDCYLTRTGCSPGTNSPPRLSLSGARTAKPDHAAPCWVLAGTAFRSPHVGETPGSVQVLRCAALWCPRRTGVRPPVRTCCTLMKT